MTPLICNEQPLGADPKLGWITPELLAETRRVWSEVYGREVSAAEATEILMNVKRLAKVVAQLKGSG